MTVLTPMACILEEVLQGEGRLLQPALDGDVAVLDVGAHGDLLAVLFDRRPEEGLVVDRRRAQDDPGDPGGEVGLHCLHIPDAAADLHEQGSILRYSGHDGQVGGGAVTGSLQVNQMDEFGTRRLKVAGDLDGVFAIDRHLGVVALVEADGLLVV